MSASNPCEIKRQKRRFLVFAPEGGVRTHFQIMTKLARILVDLGHHVDLAYCEALYERCVVMDSSSTTPNAPRPNLRDICEYCRAVARAVPAQYHVNIVDLAPYHRRAHVIEAARLVARAEDPAELVYDDLSFGVFALHDVLLARKIMATEAITGDDRIQLEETLRTTLDAYQSLSEMIRDRAYTDVLIMGQYALLAAAAMAAEKNGASWRTISNPSHFGNDRRRLTINRVHGRHMWYGYIQAWPQWRDVPLNQGEMLEVLNDIYLRLSGQGSHTYSPAKTVHNVIDALGLRHDRKLIVAFTSSLDERQANDISERAWTKGAPPADIQALEARPRAFPDQASWLAHIVDWVRARDDLQLVIRIHPREDSNKRENVTSRHLEILRQKLVDLPENVKVIWPREEVSSYDLLEAAHLAQAAWSTIGLEAARLGVPTMTSDGFNTYPVGDFILGPPTPEAFSETMETLLRDGPSLERVILAFRFYALSRLHSSVSIAEINSKAHVVDMEEYVRPKSAEIIERLLTENISAEDIHREMRPETTPALVEEERSIIQFTLRHIIRFLMLGKNETNRDYLLGALAVKESELRRGLPTLPENEAVLLYAGDMCRFVMDGVETYKWSPMVARLAALCGNRQIMRRSEKAA